MLTEGQVKELVVLDMEAKERKEDYLMRATHCGAEPEGNELRRMLYLTYRTDSELLQMRRDSVFEGTQLGRLKQLASQHLTNDPKRAFGLLSHDVEKQLNLTADQRNTFKVKSASMAERLVERERELRLELDKLRAEMRKELMGTLNQPQQATLQKLWGNVVPVPPPPEKR
jgi:hypothetical protein